MEYRSCCYPTGRLPAAASSPRQPMSWRQNPSGQSIAGSPRMRRHARRAGRRRWRRSFSTRPPAARMRPSRIRLGAGVEDLHVRHRRRAVEAADFAAALRRSGIAARRHHHGDRARHRSSADRSSASSPSYAACSAGSRSDINRGSSAWHSGSPNRTLNSISFAPLGGQHQPGIQHAAERRAAPRHLGERRTDDAVHRGVLQRRGERRRRRVGAHAAGVRTGLALADALVVLRGAERQRGRRRRTARTATPPRLPGTPRSPPRRRPRRTLVPASWRRSPPALPPRSPPPPRPCRRPGRPPSPRSARHAGARTRAPPRHRRTAPIARWECRQRRTVPW